MGRGLGIACLVIMVSHVAPVPAWGEASVETGIDDRLAAAERYVDESERYLHHSKLVRGMTGYGLTVLSGTDIVQFQAEIVSVMTKFAPHQDVILARLSGQGLEKTHVVSGMSGSPVFVRDPADGKDKLIGAVAFGWSFQNEALCGIQPITQMLAASGLFAEQSNTQDGSAGGFAVSAHAPREYLAAVLDPRKIGFPSLGLRPDAPEAEAFLEASPHLVPLQTPLMVCGVSGRTISMMAEALRPMNLVPVASGGVGSAAVSRKVSLAPGAVVSVPVVTGDVDWYAVGTVTDIIGDRVLGFGHAFFGEGELDLPMGTGYVHAVVSSMYRSFKVSSTLQIVGALRRDEHVGVTGRIGQMARMIPLSLSITWPGQGVRKYAYEICRHRWLTSALVQFLLYESAWSWRDLPLHHTVRYTVVADFGDLGEYRADNLSAASDVADVASDASRPIYALYNNPFGKEVLPEAVRIEMAIEPRQRSARIFDLKLDGRTYKPGDTITGRVMLRPFRADDQMLKIRFPLPKDLPEGRYSIVACDAAGALSQSRRERPHLFDPRSTKELFEAIKLVVADRADRIYLRMSLPTGGIAIEQQELPELPESKARMIREANLPRTHPFENALVRTVEAEYVISGKATAGFTVKLRPKQTLLH